MTDGVGLAMALSSQQPGVLPPVASSPPQNYQPPLPAGPLMDLKPLLDHVGQVSEGIRSAVKPAGSPDDEREKEQFPELRRLDEMYEKLREFTMVELQFTLIGKSLQIAERNLQALYQQQG